MRLPRGGTQSPNIMMNDTTCKLSQKTLYLQLYMTGANTGTSDSVGQ